MTAEAIHENKIPYMRMAPYDGVLVHGVVFVMSGPCTPNLVVIYKSVDVKMYPFHRSFGAKRNSPDHDTLK